MVFNGHIPSGLILQTSKLIDMLSEGKEGDRLTDEEMTRVCGRDTRPNGKGYPNLGSAIRYVIRTKGLVWERIRGEDVIECKGLKGKMSIAERNQRHIHRQSKRTLQVLGTVTQSEIPEADRPGYHVRVAQLGALASMSSSATTKKLTARSVQDIDPAKLLEAIVKSST